MSHSYDVMSKVWAVLVEQLPSEFRDGEMAMRFGFLIEEMHEANHRLKDAINKDHRVSRAASQLDDAFHAEFSNVHSVFVYGTLKTGQPNHGFLKEGGAECLGAAEAPGVVYGPFPVAKPSDSTEDWIKGELYMVNSRTLRQLDRLEGHPQHYTRTGVKLRDGRTAAIYYYATDVRTSKPCPNNEWIGRTPINNSRKEERKR